MLEDTIAAIATPPGIGGIAVIRVSGPGAETILKRLFRPRKPLVEARDRHLYHGDILSPETGATLDEVLVALMRGPNSYTGEDVLEIHSHGGLILPQKILSAIILAGARPAEAGEFTRRAFLNGRMDLAQAEAIGDMITANTDRGLEVALSHLKGNLSREIHGLAGNIAEILAEVEATIDFADDMEEVPSADKIPGRLQAVAENLQQLAATFEEGRQIRNGLRLVIAGRANVGKSSLLNRLLGEKRAIVSPVPGTTRDFIEESIDLQGMALVITDTAGIRMTDNDIEQAGMDMVWEQIAMADAVLVLLDGSEPLTPQDGIILEKCRTKSIIPVINKCDLPQALREDDIDAAVDWQPIRISAKFDVGIEALKASIYEHFMTSRHGGKHQAAIITNLRHKIALDRAASFLLQAAGSAAGNCSPELTATDVRDALDSLEEISGKTTTGEILDLVFSKFCIGK
jgi:tRNA modification GTPase